MKTFYKEENYRVGSKGFKEETKEFKEIKEAQAYALELERKHKQRSYIVKSITLVYDY